MRAPDTSIPCPVCNGSKRSPYGHPANRTPCGACFGFGLSTAPYDQRRNATTITCWIGEGLSPEARGLTVHSSTPVSARGRQGFICLVSWPNAAYRGV